MTQARTTRIQITDARLFRAAQTAAATNDVRYFLNGAYISPEGDVVGTNGHRLFLAKGIAKIEAPLPRPYEEGIICRLDGPRSLNLVPATKTVTSGTFELDLDTRQGTYTASNGKRFLAEVIDGTFPDYKSVLPAERPPKSKRPALAYLGVNPQYLADIATVLKATATYIRPHSTGKDGALTCPLEVTFYSPDDPISDILYRYVVMPVRY